MAFKLPRLPLHWDKQPQLFERYWDEAMGQIEKTLNVILDIPAIQAAIDAATAAAASATTAASAANTAATAAQATSDATTAETSLVNSYIDSTSFTAPLISVGASGLVTIKTHTRIYGDSTLNPSVSVTGATVATTGVTDDVVRIYYDDPTRAGGAVIYQYTLDPAAPPVQSGDRHSVGSVIIPASGTNNGKFVTPRGYVDPI